MGYNAGLFFPFAASFSILYDVASRWCEADFQGSEIRKVFIQGSMLVACMRIFVRSSSHVFCSFLLLLCFYTSSRPDILAAQISLQPFRNFCRSRSKFYQGWVLYNAIPINSSVWYDDAVVTYPRLEIVW